VSVPPVTTSLTTQKVESIPLSALPKDIASELADLLSTLSLYCLTLSMEAVNANILRILVQLDEEI